MLVAAKLMIAAALARTESRGGHYRSDFPDIRSRLAPPQLSLSPMPSGSRRIVRVCGSARRSREANLPMAVKVERPVLPEPLVADAVRAALREDLGRAGDITSVATIPEKARANAVIAARKPGVLAGLALAERAFRRDRSVGEIYGFEA